MGRIISFHTLTDHSFHAVSRFNSILLNIFVAGQFHTIINENADRTAYQQHQHQDPDANRLVLLNTEELSLLGSKQKQQNDRG